MKIFVAILAAALLAALAFLVVGPMLPEGSFVQEAAADFRRVLNAWWGFPLGFPG